jgi:hypothetical protein
MEGKTVEAPVAAPAPESPGGARRRSSININRHSVRDPRQAALAMEKQQAEEEEEAKLELLTRCWGDWRSYIASEEGNSKRMLGLNKRNKVSMIELLTS